MSHAVNQSHSATVFIILYSLMQLIVKTPWHSGENLELLGSLWQMKEMPLGYLLEKATRGERV